MDENIVFIGAGNMAAAIAEGILPKFKAENITLTDISKDRLNYIKEKLSVKTSTDNKKAAISADILFLAVKPNVYKNIISEIKDCVKKECIIVSIIAGQSIEKIEKLFEKEVKIVRVMPNTPALVGEGMSAACANKFVSDYEFDKIMYILNLIGKAEKVPEYLMDIVTAVSGSSPAYVFMFIEAMADAAVEGGMPRNQAYKFAAQSVLGAAKMVLETGLHPAVLKDNVCSPAGTTIEAVAELEKLGMRNAVISAIRVCRKKSESLT